MREELLLLNLFTVHQVLITSGLTRLSGLSGQRADGGALDKRLEEMVNGLPGLFREALGRDPGEHHGAVKAEFPALWNHSCSGGDAWGCNYKQTCGTH